MIGKYSPQELITPEEAIALFEYGTIAEMYTAKALFDIYRQRHGVDADRLWDTMRVLSFAYDTGRIQGIREERAKARGAARKEAANKITATREAPAYTLGLSLYRQL